MPPILPVNTDTMEWGGTISIIFDHHDEKVLDTETFATWFPINPGTSHNGYIDGGWFTDQVSDRVRDRFNISTEKVRTVIKMLFDRIGHDSFYRHGDPRARLALDLRAALNSDIDNPVWGEGLSRSRRRFVVLAYLARQTHSAILAGVLVDFCLQHMHEIRRREDDHYLTQEWLFVFKKIEHLASHHAPPGYWPGADLDRPRILFEPDLLLPNSRPLSAPGIIRRRHSSHHLVPVGRELMIRHSPTMTPGPMLEVPAIHQIRAMQYNQERMAHQLRNVQQDIALLKFGGF